MAVLGFRTRLEPGYVKMKGGPEEKVKRRSTHTDKKTSHTHTLAYPTGAKVRVCWCCYDSEGDRDRQLQSCYTDVEGDEISHVTGCQLRPTQNAWES